MRGLAADGKTFELEGVGSQKHISYLTPTPQTLMRALEAQDPDLLARVHAEDIRQISMTHSMLAMALTENRTISEHEAKLNQAWDDWGEMNERRAEVLEKALEVMDLRRKEEEDE